MNQPDQDNNRNEAIKKIRSAAKVGDAAELAAALIELIHLEPTAWLRIILLDSVFPDANSRDWTKRLPAFMKALSQVAESNLLPLDSLDATMRTLVALLDIGPRLQRIAKRLDGARFFNRSKSTQIFRLATWLESQSALLPDAVAKVAISGGNYDPIAALQTSISGPGITGGVAPVSSWEAMADAAELVLKYLIWRQQSNPFGAIDPLDSPYNSPDFTEICKLSVAWQDLEGVWADVKFNGWLPKQAKDAIVFLPPDQDDLHRRFVSLVRQGRFEAQEIALWVNGGPPPSNDEWDIRKMARAVHVPPPGAIWKCTEISAERLRQASRDTFFLRVVQYEVEKRHYKPLVDNLAGGMGPNAVSWPEWLAARNVLAIICEVFRQAAQNQLHDPEEKRERSVVPVRVAELASLVSASTGLTLDRAQACIDFMIFAGGQRGIGLFDQPLLPVGENLVLLVPCLVMMANAVYSLENFVSAFGIGDFSQRGIPFEKSIAADLKEHAVPCEADVWAVMPDGNKMNYDTVCWWMGYLILIEAKCVRTAFSSADDFHTRSAVNESINQLIRRRDSLAVLWSSLRDAVPSLSLPGKPPNADRVFCVSVTNSMRFTGLVQDGVICTDDLCLMKYFDAPLSPVYKLDGARLAVVGYVRNRADILNPPGWMEYLRHPPQIRSLEKEVKIAFRGVLRLPDDPNGLVVPTYTYSGSMNQVIESLSGIMDRTK